MQAAVDQKLTGKSYTVQGPFGLRPGVMLNVWIEKSLWDRYELRKKQEATSQ